MHSPTSPAPTSSKLDRVPPGRKLQNANTIIVFFLQQATSKLLLPLGFCGNKLSTEQTFATDGWD
ncbi:unnamed protein product [Fusarium graminearum]|nr:unnamed protein product [Fusarium graminearum]